MKTSTFEYDLPEELIAQYPPETRGDSRLMVLDRKNRTIKHRKYADIVEYMTSGDLAVLNETKVIWARTYPVVARTGRKVEVFFLNKIAGAGISGDLNKNDYEGMEFWYCLVGRARHVKIGDKLKIGGLEIFVVNRKEGESGFIIATRDAKEIMEKYGHVPLPPYIDRPDSKEDKVRYNTVFARKEGSVASNTASLNVTKELLGKFAAKGVDTTYVNLVVGWGTFAPVNTEQIEDFKIHEEFMEVKDEAARMVNSCDGRVFVFGTTALRAIETSAVSSRKVNIYSGETDLYVYPGYNFKITDALITNFHRPRSSLLVLVCAFAGTDFILEAYREAIEKGYRFLSYGDSMLIL
ncbi:tRNA preQ1(34) S-adenosylmethionine ribosyltransferase-isomerase QueA [Candidatus Dojkabacteria bacterium]|nr:tRNA preQ1(34) S-adenosylmethionine ribosyltransferase-isomerase QueA [Candidatus Dojkabacteria bacterium]